MMINSKCERLPSGIRVVTAPMPHVESISMGVWVGAGGRCEAAAQSGVSHFLEHILFKGTTRRTAREISQAIEGRGGDINAFTQEENTCYYARVAAAHSWQALDVLLDMIQHPRMSPVDIKKERDVIIEEIMMVRDQPHQQVEETLGELMWLNHPLGRPLAGTCETVKAIGREELLAYKAKHYVPANIVVAFAGKLDHAACVERVQAAFPEKGRALPLPFAPLGKGVKRKPLDVLSKEVEQAHMALGFRTFGRRDPRRFALKLFSVILGENMSSRLFQVVREQYGLAYAIQCGGHMFHDTGGFVITGGLDRTRLERAMALIARELRRIKETPVGKRELERARDYSIGQIQLGLESTTSQMMWIGEHILAYGRVKAPEEGIESLKKVTAAEIQQLACEILRPEHASLAMVLPDAGGRVNAKLESWLGTF
ncbi:MAG: pitrilysin family protein [bacterium]|jgi:predicted Zn-dependent peptidase